MTRLTQLLLATAALTSCLACQAPRTSNGVGENRAQASFVVHDVYFELRDDSKEEVDRLVAGCFDYLHHLPGIAHFAAGRRDNDRTGEVNDSSFDVSLHVWFENQDAYTIYETHPDHLEFIDAFRENWASVRVFDSVVGGR